MKNNQKGFAVSLIITIIAILAIGGGAYVYVNKKTVNTPSADATTSSAVKATSRASASTSATTSAVDTKLVTTSTVTFTKNVKTSIKTDTFSSIASGDVTTKVDCGDEACFNKKFIACEPSILKADAGPASVEYKILNKTANGCSLTFKYTNYPDPTWTNKEMTCEFNNKITFQDSLQKVFIGVTTGEMVCIGPLYDILHKK
jgi:hypothetical protein